VHAAAKEYGAKIVGYDEVSLGTSDYTTVLQKVRAAKPDVFIAAQFAVDAVALLKQVQQMGLNKVMRIFNAFTTNVVAKGLDQLLYYSIGGYITYSVSLATGNVWVGVVAGCAVAGVVAFAVERLIFRRIYERELTYSMITSFGILIGGIGVIKYFWGVGRARCRCRRRSSGTSSAPMCRSTD
jgi:hypothetical protein